MHDDDARVGRLLSRREIIALLGASGVALAVDPLGAQTPGALPACVVQPEQTEGPYFVDKMLERSDIRLDPATRAVTAGLPLRLAFTVSQMGSDGACKPLPGAQVDLWQCDAAGVYSGVKDRSFDTSGKHFLRGHQTTDAKGVASFVTIYPGWYPGRAVHVHFKIRTTPAAQQGQEFTSQLYFDEALTDRVYAREPYSTRQGQRQRNEQDGIFRNGGKQLVLPVTESGGGYSGAFSLALHTAGARRSGG